MRKLFAALLAGTLIIAAKLNAATPNPYPNEISGMEFYSHYLAPLLPGQSDWKQVVRVFGSDEGLDLKNWRVGVLYRCAVGDSVTCSHGPRNDILDTIEVTPKSRVSLKHFRFPAAFAHGFGGVSEVNVTCDVYTDQNGLQYWVISRNYRGYRKGDLLKIDYGLAQSTR